MNGLNKYKSFIDGLVSRRSSALAKRIQNGHVPIEAENGHKINQLLAKLTNEEREVVASMIQRGKDDGIHTVLSYLSEEMLIRGLELVQDGVMLPKDPFETEIFFDWIARRDGKKWPDEQ